MTAVSPPSRRYEHHHTQPGGNAGNILTVFRAAYVKCVLEKGGQLTICACTRSVLKETGHRDHFSATIFQDGVRHSRLESLKKPIISVLKKYIFLYSSVSLTQYIEIVFLCNIIYAAFGTILVMF